jgi:hypothetical protein
LGWEETRMIVDDYGLEMRREKVRGERNRTEESII